MAEKLPPHFVELVQDALLKSYWRRKAFRNILRRNGVAEKFLASWADLHSSQTSEAYLAAAQLSH